MTILEILLLIFFLLAITGGIGVFALGNFLYVVIVIVVILGLIRIIQSPPRV